MPSLSALSEFKVSFQNLGNETKTLAELRMPIDDLPLPDKEPEIIVEEPLSAEPEYTPDTDELPLETGPPYPDYPDEPTTDTGFIPDLNDILGGDSAVGEPETTGFETSSDASPDDFSDILPDDFTLEETPVAETGLAEDFQTEGFPSKENVVPDEDDYSVPSDLLDGFANEIEAGEALPGEEDGSLLADDMFGGDLSDLGLSDEGPGDLPEMDLGEGPELSEEEISVSEDTATEISDETPFDFQLPEELPALDETGTGGEELLDLGSDDMGSLDDSVVDFDDMGLSSEGLGEAAGEESGEFPSFDLEDIADFGEEEGEIATSGEAAPSFEDIGAFPDDVSLDESLDSGGIESLIEASDEAEMPSDFQMTDDLADLEAAAGIIGPTEDLPGDDDSFDYTAAPTDNEAEARLEEVPGDSFDTFSLDPGVVVGDTGFGGGFGDTLDSLEDIRIPGLDDVDEEIITGAPGRAKAPAEEEVEEINLSTDELEKLLTTLTSYPLNLRIACSELIVEQMVAPAQMSKLVRLLINEAPAEETAGLAGKILERPIPIPKGYEKSSGEALEAEQATFAYIFVHNFLPVLGRFMMIAGLLFCLGFLVWEFIYTPIRAERIYKLGLERIEAGEYSRANERFLEAYNVRPKKPWFYTYARAFRDARQYTLADEKYRELLYYTASKNKQRIPEKAAVLEYADMKTRYIGDYESADSILRNNILVYSPLDKDALLALANNSLEWGDYEPERLEDARESFALLMERYGRTDPLMEGMLKYFIRTDKLGYVLEVKNYFMDTKKTISPAALTEMGGYILDKIIEEVRGVPNEYLDYIKDNRTLVEIRQMLLRAIYEDELLPESYYHLARYYNYLGNYSDEGLTLEVAVQAFDYAREENTRRIGYHIKTLQRYAEILIDKKEFFPAEEALFKGVNVYQNALARRLLKQTPEFGRLYTSLGDLEYFVKDGDKQSALDYYALGEQNGWAPPEIQYRMGAAHYQLREWGPALERLYAAYREVPPNRRILYALGNVSYMRGNYFVAQGYYDRLLELLESDRVRLPPIMATNNAEELDLAERLMIAQNNLGVTLEALSERTGDNSFRSRALGLYSDSERAWDILTRNPDTMARMRPSPDISAPSVNPAYLNVQNSLRPVSTYQPQIFLRIDKDMLEPSPWEGLTPPGYSLSEGIYTGR